MKTRKQIEAIKEGLEYGLAETKEHYANGDITETEYITCITRLKGQIDIIRIILER